MLSGFIAGFLAFIGAHSLLRVIALLGVRPLPGPPLTDALVGLLALPLAVALLLRTARSLVFARLYLGLNLLGQIAMLIITLVFRWHSLLPTVYSGITTVFMLICFCFTFVAREKASGVAA